MEKLPNTKVLGSWACPDLNIADLSDGDDIDKLHHCVADDKANCDICVPSNYLLKHINYSKQNIDNAPKIETPVYVPTKCTCVKRHTLNHVVDNRRCDKKNYTVEGKY